eukprot:scaffold13088_cov77-Skeletonema_dohrnii-CCMP3373.AAC.2
MSDPLSRDRNELVQELVNALVKYYIRVHCDATIEGLQETMEKFPAEFVEEAIVESKLLPAVLSSEYVALDLVTYLVDLAPTVVSTVDTGEGEIRSWLSSSSNEGSLPLHTACRKKNCPTSVVKFLIEKYPSAVGHAWTKGYSYPLHCYLMRAIKREEYHEYDEEIDEVTEHPEIPGQELDYDIVEMLVRAYPEALTATASLGSPLNILCQGCTVTLELAQLLTDEELKCFEVDVEEVEFPMRCLLMNRHGDSFPTDVFRYFMKCSPSSLRRQNHAEFDDENNIFDGATTLFTDTLLHVACSNPKISVEAIQIIVNECPYMVKEEYAEDGFLPIHNICCNENLDDESSIEILKILVNEFPESVMTNVGVANSLPDWCSRERGENDLPIHYACRYKSLDFCRYLLEMYPESVSKKQLHYSHEGKDSGSLMLPFHLACKYGSLDLVQYLLEPYPEALGEQTSDRNYNCDEKKGRYRGRYAPIRYSESNTSLLQVGNYPLHLAASREDSPDKMDIINFLLQQDVDAVSQVGKYGNLPLHRACWHPSEPDIEIIKHLVHVYPAAIHTKNIFGQLPIHLAMQTSDESNFEGLTFLAQQQPEPSVFWTSVACLALITHAHRRMR